MQSENPFEGYLSLREASKISGRAEQTLRDMGRRGVLTRYYFGKFLYFKIDELRPKAAPKPAPDGVTPRAHDERLSHVADLAGS
jgi:hypothetical protein